MLNPTAMKMRHSILQLISKKFNLQYQVEVVDWPKGYIDFDNIYNNQSLYGWFCLQEMDIELTRLHTIGDIMLPCLDAGPPHFYHEYEYGWGFYTQLPNEVPIWKAVFKPYDGNGWMAIFIACILILATSIVLDKHFSLFYALSWIMITLTSKGIAMPIPKLNSLAVHVISWTLAAAILHYGYASSMVAGFAMKEVELVPRTFQDLLDMDYTIKLLETSETDRTPLELQGQILKSATKESNLLYYNLWQRYLQDYSNDKAERVIAWTGFRGYYKDYMKEKSKLAVLVSVSDSKYNHDAFKNKTLMISSVLANKRQAIMLFRKSFTYLMEFNQL